MARSDKLLYAGLAGVVLLGLASSKRRSKGGFGGGNALLEGIPAGSGMLAYVVEPSGRILVAPDDKSAAFAPPMLPSSQRAGLARMVSRWGALVDQVGTVFRVPSSMLYGVMWAESAGDPDAWHRNPNGTIDAGLMQINEANWRGNTLAGVLVPETNLKIAGDLLRSAYGGFRDLVQIASSYNAGHKADGSPYTNADRPAIATRWGFAASPGYIDTVVAASNTYLRDFGLGAAVS